MRHWLILGLDITLVSIRLINILTLESFIRLQVTTCTTLKDKIIFIMNLESISFNTRPQTGSNQNYTKRVVRPAPAINPPPSSSSAAKSSEIHYGSKYRPEALSHFPFIDENGTVYDVFRNGLVNKPDLLNMGQPGREKLIQKVFDTMRFDRNGIRLSDLPEALQVINCSCFVSCF